VRKGLSAIHNARRLARILETVGATSVDVLRVVVPVIRIIIEAAKRIRGI